MKKSSMILLVLLLSMPLMGTQAAAAIDDNDKPVVSVTPYLGAGFWSKDMGVEDSFLFGARGAFHLTRSLAIEGTYGRSSSDRSLDGVGVDLDHYGVDLLWELMPRAKWVPYIAGGWAQMDYNASGAAHTEVLNGAEVAIGVKTRLGGNNANYRALRIDLRDVMSNLTPSFPNENKTTHNFIATVGLQIAFGKSSKDGDGDGVRDRDDACAATPVGAVIDAAGCPVDSDGDGVFDGLDNCEGTPAGATVDASGCPTDSDGDGVYGGIDQCAETPAGAVVDAMGCPVDSDGDGVFDGLDKCPDTPEGKMVDDFGCPLTETEVQLLDTGIITTNQIVFASSSAEIDLAHSSVLMEIGETLSNWPELLIEINGYTDSTGSAAFNQDLSQRRAQAVLEYLNENYPEINISQFTAVGRGEENPIADNSTPEGRQANRRVEFRVLNTEELKRVIEKQ